MIAEADLIPETCNWVDKTTEQKERNTYRIRKSSVVNIYNL